MHDWSEESFDWKGLDDAGWFIGGWLVRWARLSVFQIKEKFGTLRIYCGFGWSSFYSIYRPRHCWISPWWPRRLDLVVSKYLMPVLNKVVIPIQKKLYRYRYKKAVQKWPHLKLEILISADYGELLNGLAGYNYADYWEKINESN